MQIEIKEKVDKGIWYRLGLLPELFVGLSSSTAKAYTKEMENIPEFSGGILKPGHSTTFVNYETFVEFLKFKEKKEVQVMKNTIKTLALTTAVIGLATVIKRVQKTKTIKVRIGDIDSYPEWVRRDLINSKQSYSAVDENGITTILADGSVATLMRQTADAITIQKLLKNNVIKGINLTPERIRIDGSKLEGI